MRTTGAFRCRSAYLDALPKERSKTGSTRALLAAGMTQAPIARNLNIGIVSMYCTLKEDASCQQGK